MKVKSNIAISSNIYIKTTNLENDVDFVKNVTGHKALKKLESRLSGTLVKAKLNHIQRREVKNSLPCSKAKNNELTHGKVMKDGKVTWAGRCEYTACSNYQICSDSRASDRIFRVDVTEEQAQIETIDFDIEEYTYLGLNLEDDEFEEAMSGDERIYEDLKEEYKIENKEEIIEQEEEIEIPATGFREIEQPDEIITSNIGSKIFVNAGPGTGKTYTVIQRLLHIIKNKIARPECILVLCYSRAAVEVINNRIQEGIADGTLHPVANMLNVCTFDSFATQYLIAADEEEFSHLDYNQRIVLFNRKISPEMLEHFEYLIVDELQDLVNQRAQMVINIMNNIKCGYLLLGDRCQAIYDYDCDDGRSIKSTEFYEKLLDIVGNDISKYELIKNNRQEELLSGLTNEIRQVLLTEDFKSQNEKTQAFLKNIPRLNQKAEKFIPRLVKGQKMAILCRNNGEAETISERFYGLGIDHTLLRGAAHPVMPHRWLGDVLWDYCEPSISQADFINRVIIRLGYEEQEAENLFNTVKGLVDQDANFIKINELVSLIKKGADLPEEIINPECEDISISTIHRAKGREYDSVCLIDSDYDIDPRTAEESRVRYVAVTRPKQDLKIVEKNNFFNWFFRRLDSGRSIRVFYKYKSWCYCTNIALGLKGDVDDVGFVSKTLFDEIGVISNQQYIAEKVKKNDELLIRFNLDKERYLIYHKEKLIGALSKEMEDEFWKAVRKTSNKKNIPDELTRIYVKNVVTIINTKFDDDIPLKFRESNIWLGIEITGLARTKFEKG